MEFIIYTENAMDRETGSYHNFVSSIKYASPMHSHEFYEFFIITSGNAIHDINGQKQPLREGMLVFIRPKDVHAYEYGDDGDCQFLNIPYPQKAIHEAFEFMGKSFDSRRLLEAAMPPSVMLSPLEKNNFMERFNRIYMSFPADKPRVGIQLRSFLIEILTQYFMPGVNPHENKMPLWLESLLIQIQRKENFAEGVSKLYSLSGRSVGHINRVFKEWLGMTPTDYINHIRLNYAKTLLLTTHYSIMDIAMEAGFNNLSHFYHLFKKYFNISPSMIRNHDRQKKL